MKIRLGDLRTFIMENLPPVKKIPPGVHGPEYLARRKKMKAPVTGTAYDAYPNYMRAKAYQTHGLGDISYEPVEMTNLNTDGSTLADIAREMEISVSGVHQLVQRALSRAKKFAYMGDGDFDEFLDRAVTAYVDKLASTGEISDEEIADMKMNPEAVQELEGFREFLGSMS